VDDVSWRDVWLLPFKYLLTNKVREISFKIIHKFYPAKHYLRRLKRDIDVSCSFCETADETVLHLFWYCHCVQLFWKDVARFIKDHIWDDFSLFWKNVLFGFISNDRSLTKELYLTNLIILLAKFHIHKCKFTNKKPLFIVFSKECEIYFSTLKNSVNKKAVKTTHLCYEFGIFPV